MSAVAPIAVDRPAPPPEVAGAVAAQTDTRPAPARREQDRVELSPEARRAAAEQPRPTDEEQAPEPGEPTARDGSKLSDEEKTEVDELKQRDQEVRRHEQAHVAAGGQYVTGGPTYEFTTGPDGQRYATGGHVSIDTSEVRDDPQATIQKMQTVRRAALAPAEPSSQDRAVAADASRKMQKAQRELRQEPAEGSTQTPSAPATNERADPTAPDTPPSDAAQPEPIDPAGADPGRARLEMLV